MCSKTIKSRPFERLFVEQIAIPARFHALIERQDNLVVNERILVGMMFKRKPEHDPGPVRIGIDAEKPAGNLGKSGFPEHFVRFRQRREYEFRGTFVRRRVRLHGYLFGLVVISEFENQHFMIDLHRDKF